MILTPYETQVLIHENNLPVSTVIPFLSSMIANCQFYDDKANTRRCIFCYNTYDKTVNSLIHTSECIVERAAALVEEILEAKKKR